MHTFHWVGRGGTADMAGKRPLCALGPMMSALNFWSFCFKTKGQENRSHRCLPPHRPTSACHDCCGTAEKENPLNLLRVHGKVVILQHKILVRGCVPNFGEVTDYMTGFFYCTSILFTQYCTCFPPVMTPMVSFTTKSK